MHVVSAIIETIDATSGFVQQFEEIRTYRSLYA